MHHFHCLLLKSSQPFTPAAVQRWLAVAKVSGLHMALASYASTQAAENGQPMHHLYLVLQEPACLPPEALRPLEEQWFALNSHCVVVSRLRKVLDLPGAAHGKVAVAHYVVETDPAVGWNDEIARWYAEEHLPGLAAVPGCIVAKRFINLDHPPSSFACYDLSASAVLERPEWLAIRGTAWSSRCRPHFTNTLRTMFEQIQLMNFQE